MATNTAIPTLDASGDIPAFVARPAGQAKGAIIVIQEVFGVNPGIVKKTEDWAAKGYLAVAPDVFWRQEPGVELDSDKPEEFKKAIDLMMAHDFDRGLEDLKAVLAWIRRQGSAYQMAARTDIEAAVGYYGVGIDQMLGEKDTIKGKLLLHVPTADGFVPPEAQKAMHEGLDGHPNVILMDYPGLDHGFADTFSNRRDEAGAQLADSRTEAFFGQYVG